MKLNPETGKYETISTKLGTARPGMTKLTTGEREILGNTQPAVNGGFGLNFNIGGEKWGKVDVATQFTYSVGNKVLNLSALDYSTIIELTMYRNCASSVSYGNRYSMYAMNGVNFESIPETKGVTTMMDKSNFAGNLSADQEVVFGNNYNALASLLDEANANASAANPVSEKLALTDKYVEDASFLRMSSLTVGYTLPDKYMKKAYIQKLRVFFTASNICSPTACCQRHTSA